MTSTTTGLPDRYRPLDEVGPAATTATGVIRCWRAKDRILNRDVEIRVHSPGGPAAREWITRALTAGGLATPALAMVYDAAEGSGDSSVPGGAAYVVNEWIEGQTLAERLATGPMPDREARTVLRRLAEGVAEAHRVGLAVGGLTPEAVVLRPNGLVGLRAVPAATGTIQDDIAALAELLEYCLTGRRAGVPAGPGRAPVMAPDLAALVRRARSTEPGAGLSSVAAMAALLAERPRGTHPSEPLRGADETDSGWLRRLRERRDDEDTDDPAPTRATSGADVPQRLDPRGRPPVPAPRGDAADDDLLPLSGGFGLEDDGTEEPDDRPAASAEPVPEARRRLLVVGLPLLALAVVIGLAWWVGSNLLSVADSVGGDGTASPPPSSSAPADEGEEAPEAGAPVTVAGSSVFNPFGDGDPENEQDVALSHDGDPATSWSTVTYRGSAAFGNLKPGVGVLYDLGSAQALSGATVTTTTPGVVVEVRTGDTPDGDLDGYPVAATGPVDGTADLTFDEPVTAQYVLVWITQLTEAEGGFSGDLAEVEPLSAG
ncbi:hypothetical protein GCU56_20245 [Geodermatophilus sabuli]|uniref:Peptidoglycan lipid II flippase n=1 Tax=Geodermatophilus sabuli TaxID=1564158 RepID=A0A7K3W600_9ACTN|nr:protein kinase family protein [Geodermatophilus sabuli]NEK60191.1 hypothetical protein [Geodermatophilus sabuli]